MRHLRKFTNYSEYSTYLAADDIWLPRVSYIVNGNTSVGSKYEDTGCSWVDYSRLGTKFVEIINDGVMYFTDQVIDGITYHAGIENGQLVITTTDADGNYTDDASVINDQIAIYWPE